MTTNCNTQLSVNVMCGNQIPREAIYITIVPHNIYILTIQHTGTTATYICLHEA